VRSFRAAAIGAVELADEETFAVVLAEQADGSGRRLELQISLIESTPDEAALGMDTYCLCTDDGRTDYGGVQSWDLVADRLTIRLEPAAAEKLDVDGGFEIQLADHDPIELRAGLTRVLGEALMLRSAHGRAREL
jgi:hypothetical protein